jgi:hypothetical protein
VFFSTILPRYRRGNSSRCCVRGWVNPRVSLDVVENNFPSLLGIETRLPRRPTHSPVALPNRLSYYHFKYLIGLVLARNFTHAFAWPLSFWGKKLVSMPLGLLLRMFVKLICVLKIIFIKIGSSSLTQNILSS